MKITPPDIRVSPYAESAPASGVIILDPGGFIGGPMTLEQFIALYGAGLLGPFLTVIGGGKGTVNAMGTLGATPVIDLALGNLHWGTLDQDATLTTTGWTAGKDCQITVEVIEDGTGGWVPTFTGITWIGGFAPAHISTAGSVTHYVFFSRDGGTTIYGAQLGSASEGGGSAPTRVIAGEVIRIPDRRQMLFSAPIVIDAGGGISIGSEAALIGVS